MMAWELKFQPTRIDPNLTGPPTQKKRVRFTAEETQGWNVDCPDRSQTTRNRRYKTLEEEERENKPRTRRGTKGGGFILIFEACSFDSSGSPGSETVIAR